jgi:hypothetical protein
MSLECSYNIIFIINEISSSVIQTRLNLCLASLRPLSRQSASSDIHTTGVQLVDRIVTIVRRQHVIPGRQVDVRTAEDSGQTSYLPRHQKTY